MARQDSADTARVKMQRELNETARKTLAEMRKLADTQTKLLKTAQESAKALGEIANTLKAERQGLPEIMASRPASLKGQ